MIEKYVVLLNVAGVTFRNTYDDLRTAWRETYRVARKGQEVYLLSYEGRPRSIACSTAGGERLFLCGNEPDASGTTFRDVYNKRSCATNSKWRKRNILALRVAKMYGGHISTAVMEFVDRIL